MGDLIPFDAAQPPAVMNARASGSLAAAQAGVQASFAVLAFKGRTWKLKYRGEETLLKDARGVPYPEFDVVIVGVSPAISKQWYEKSYVEGSDAAPDCFSVDGIQPDASSPSKQCETCAVCPRNRWGSRISEDGKKGKECQDSRRLAVVPMGDLENESFGGPIMLRLPPTSLSNFANYASLLQRKGAAGTEFVATRLGFDYDVAYPRITFTPVGWLNEEQAVQIVGPDGRGGVCAHENIGRMLQEAVVEATHDPESALDQGGPAAVFTNGQNAAAPTATLPSPAPTTQPAAAEPQAPSVPRRARATTAFNPTPAGATSAPVASPPATVVTPSPDAPAPTPVAGPPTTIAEAPDDLNAAIESLLAS